ncbi:MAG: FkbM family methyltransferase [Proteobacteria bacterium]|nr:FkbM family methyltransferase [Pseudomonadota bacterium]MBS0574541.1 FkbM family methyltransferase [Pseudomonadota bacterium]
MVSKAKPAATDLPLMDLMLLQQAQNYDLNDSGSRRKSRDDLQQLFYGLQKVLKPQAVLEIGAYRAEFSVRMARAGIEAHAFEANPYNHGKFADEIAATGYPVRYQNCAMSDRDGEVSFEIKRRVNGVEVSPGARNNSLMRRAPDFGEVEYETVTVPSVRLATYLARHGLAGRTFSAWIDVEGALGRVMAGFGGALANCLSLIVEVEEIPYWDGQMLYAQAMAAFRGEGFLPVARDFESRFQHNIVFLRAPLLQDPAVRLLLAGHFDKG